MSSKHRVRIVSPKTRDKAELDKLREEDEEETEDEIPMHHQVLYDLLGEDKAESILNPKIEEPSARRQSIHPGSQAAILLPTIDTGMGAEAIWKMLKEKSDRKITRLERRIPDEWKQAYGAFLRDRLSQNKSLHFRSFTDKEDVPDLDILKQKDYVFKVRRMRNHTNVMFRSSESNQNHTTLLLNNNPVPECAQEDEGSSLDRYFNERFLRPADVKLKAIEFSAPSDDMQQQKNLHFLTNDGAKCKGTFYEKYASQEDIKMVTDVPGYKVQLPPSMTARYTVSAPANRPSFAKEWKKEEKSIVSKKQPTWQPLTLNALMEYTPSKATLGSGEFGQGRVSKWRSSISAGQ